MFTHFPSSSCSLRIQNSIYFQFIQNVIQYLMRRRHRRKNFPLQVKNSKRFLRRDTLSVLIRRPKVAQKLARNLLTRHTINIRLMKSQHFSSSSEQFYRWSSWRVGLSSSRIILLHAGRERVNKKQTWWTRMGDFFSVSSLHESSTPSANLMLAPREFMDENERREEEKKRVYCEWAWLELGIIYVSPHSASNRLSQNFHKSSIKKNSNEMRNLR